MDIKHTGLKEILKKSPPEKIAIYSLNCLWWSSFPEDAGKTDSGLSCCPFCKSPLAEMSLTQFLQAAENKQENYGPDGLGALITAHHRSARTCRVRWDRYKVKIKD